MCRCPPSIRSPSNQISPDSGLIKPEIVTERGGLASTVGADERHDLALVDLEADPLDRLGPGHTATFRSLTSSIALTSSSNSSSSAASSRSGPDVGLDHPRVRLNLSRACLSISALPCTRHSTRSQRLKMNRMSCSMTTTAKAPIADLEDQLLSLPGLLRIHACGRLVQQQQLGIRGESAGDLEPPLIAVRRDGGPDCPSCCQARRSRAALGRVLRLPSHRDGTSVRGGSM